MPEVTTKYIHEESVHNLQSPQEIVPVICRLVKPQSVVDVGCGLGTFLYCFKQQGVKRVMGIDGKWVDRSLMKKYLADEEFRQADFERPLDIAERFDLAVSLEVAEHLSEASADHFVTNLTSLSDVILFSAALPYQGGQNHLNEQPPVYWEKKFNARGFEFHDLLRMPLWDNDRIFWWYRQNMFLVTRKGYQVDMSALPETPATPARMIIHPELFNYCSHVAEASTRKLLLVETGGYSIKTYLQLLYRAILRKFGGLSKSLPVLIYNPQDPLQK